MDTERKDGRANEDYDEEADIEDADLVDGGIRIDNEGVGSKRQKRKIVNPVSKFKEDIERNQMQY